ncbi:hypothetical protein EYF80_013614 [Liparis tanakae]|uniref:Uncharacterized protein n=1 Tax=Liparis tanakae TaxID=230148 RepID=A0A4Z2IG32_9TELE|nr:hypothetical protein EYF80_013614 [Liparis tanakae]
MSSGEGILSRAGSVFCCARADCHINHVNQLLTRRHRVPLREKIHSHQTQGRASCRAPPGVLIGSLTLSS